MGMIIHTLKFSVKHFIKNAFKQKKCKASRKSVNYKSYYNASVYFILFPNEKAQSGLNCIILIFRSIIKRYKPLNYNKVISLILWWVYHNSKNTKIHIHFHLYVAYVHT